MKFLRPLRLMFLALLICLVPASSFGGVFISVGFAPPILPVYDQPLCPEAGWIWTPGYWAYGPDGYYWVPGTWVPAPYEGALWTPPYWGWSEGIYVFHPGYWGDHVGYYGGVNYGFGYMGIGFVGGMWRGHDFIYNTAVMRVDSRYIHNTYVDRDVVQRYTVANDRHVSFSGGRDGIHHDPMPQERFAERDRHVDATSFQHSHESAAMSDRSYYARNNGGHPNNVVVARPMGMQQNQGGGLHGTPNNSTSRPNYGNSGNGNNNANPGNRNFNNNAPQPNSGGNQNRNLNNSPQPNLRNNQGGGNNAPANNGNNQNRNNNAQPYVRNNQGGAYNPPANNGNNQSRPAPQQQQQQPQQQQRQQQQQPQQQQRQPQPQQQQQQHGNQGDHGDHEHDKQH